MDRKHQDGKGRFLPGNPGGPGNPHSGQVAKLRSAAMEAVDPEHFAGIMRKAVVLALEGNVQAMHFVFNRLVGKEAIKIDVGESDMVTEAYRKMLQLLARDPVLRERMEELEKEGE